ncbi:M23 family metallopeptidase [Pseudochelatococcus sp. B33]
MLQRAPVTIRTEAAAPRPEAWMRHRRSGLGGVDVSPPLDPNGIAVINQNRRRVSLRWLIGSVLTALSGATLIGGAIVIALQGEIVQVERPQRALAVAGKGEGPKSAARRADRLVRREVAGNLARQEFKAPITVRTGDREVIRTRGFVRISAPLSLTAGTYARAIPPFNPLNLFADNEIANATTRETAADADVSIVKRDLAGQFFFPAAPALNADEALAQVIAEERLMSDFSGRSILPQAGRMMLFRSLRQDQPTAGPMSYASLAEMPFSEIDVRVVPENVTLLPKLATPAEDDRSMEERLAGASGDVVLKILIDEGASRDDARAILTALDLGEKDRLREGQSLAILPTLDTAAVEAGDGAASETTAIGRVILHDEGAIKAIAALTDDGRYVPVVLPEEDPASGDPHPGNTAVASESGPGAPLYESVYETAARYNVPASLVKEIIPLFAADTDFQRRVAAGESLELLYTDDEDGDPELLYAALSTDGEMKRLYRFQPPGDGTISFYDADGRSLQKFLIRKPITEGRMTSGFGMRYHPVLSYSKLHTGVDWADRIGTPILAAGDGVVIKAGWASGYGRRIEIQHANGYVTTYSHQSRFARGIEAGVRVRQGQVIGYLGNTGLSTGPHLHYEVMVNGRFVDPMKIKLPRSDELAGADLAEFAHQRDQVKELLARSQPGSVAAAIP